MTQTSIPDAPTGAYQGQIAEPGAPRFCRSMRAEGANVVAGIPLKRGTLPATQAKPFAAGDECTPQNFAGFAVLSTSRPYAALAIEDGDSISVMRLGTIKLYLTGAAAAGQGVKLTLASGVLEAMDQGDAPGALKVQLPGVVVAHALAATGLVTCEVNLLGSADVGVDVEPLGLTRISNIPIGGVARASIGTDGASVAGTVYRSEIYVPEPMEVTGIAMLNGTTAVGTDDVIYALYDGDGNLLASTALAGTLAAVADVFQEIALTAPISINRGKHFLALQVEGTTTPHQRIATLTYLNATSSAVGVFGTLPASFTPPTTTTADVGPIGYLY